MAFGMAVGVKPRKTRKAMPQADKAAMRPHKSPKVGEDADTKTVIGGRETAPNLPDRDGPAKDSANPVTPRPPTSAPAKGARTAKATPVSRKRVASMKESLKGIGRF